jgi:type I restriction enzyme S subunit
MAVKQGYQQTEIGRIPQDWAVVNLATHSILKARIGWQGLTTKEYLETGDYYLITGTDFEKGAVQWKSCPFVEKERYDQDKNIQAKNEDILVTKDGTIGKVAFIEQFEGKATLNSGVFVIRPKNNAYLPKYFFYILSSAYFDRFLQQLTAGSTIAHLYQKEFVKFNFPLPPSVAEQQAISQALSDMDALIIALDALLTKKRFIKQGAMQQLLTGKKRLPGFKSEWETKTLPEIAFLKRGKFTPRPRNDPRFYGGNIPFVQTGDVTNSNGIISNYTQTLNEEGLSVSTLFKKGTILMTIAANIGYSGILQIDMACPDSLIAIDGILVKNEYLNHYFIFRRHDLEKLSTSGSQKNLSVELIKSFQISYPSLAEQQAIAQILSDMDAEIAGVVAQRDKYRQLKAGMMQALLTGKNRF